MGFLERCTEHDGRKESSGSIVFRVHETKNLSEERCTVVLHGLRTLSEARCSKPMLNIFHGVLLRARLSEARCSKPMLDIFHGVLLRARLSEARCSKPMLDIFMASFSEHAVQTDARYFSWRPSQSTPYTNKKTFRREVHRA
jgi:hypothetical protein